MALAIITDQGVASSVEVTGARTMQVLEEPQSDVSDQLASQIIDEVGIAENPSSYDQKTIKAAIKILDMAHRIFPCNYEVDAIEDGAISIESPIGMGSSVWFTCHPSGEIECRVNIKGKPYQKEFINIDDFPLISIEKALKDISELLA